MTWTLYIQKKKGRQIKKPVGIHGVTMSSDDTSRRLYAFQGDRLVSELVNPMANFSLLGVMIGGFEEKDAPLNTVSYLQHWWIVPELIKET